MEIAERSILARVLACRLQKEASWLVFLHADCRNTSERQLLIMLQAYVVKDVPGLLPRIFDVQLLNDKP